MAYRFLAPALLALSADSFAAEQMKICATPANGRTYTVDATVLTGMELNQKTGSFKYTSYAKYAAIFWKDHEATLIELELPGIINVYDVHGIDQEGRAWTVTMNTGVCY